MSKLKIGLILNTQSTIGGGRSYEQLMVDKVGPILRTKFDVKVFEPRTARSNKHKPDQSEICVYKDGVTPRVIQSLRNIPLVYRILNVFKLGASHLERVLESNAVDVAYFLSPNPYAQGMVGTPIIVTVWDLAHRLEVEFPEVTSGRRSEYREQQIRNSCSKALAVVVESDQGAFDVEKYYEVSRNRIAIIPFSLIVSSMGELTYPGEGFVLYPAQLWPHKNHHVLLMAMSRLKKLEREFPRLVLTGSDKGNGAWLLELVARLGLSDSVDFRGFVDDQELRRLYTSADALVMPSYFGPTNIPPIEALYTQLPIIVSSRDAISRHEDGRNILSVDPDDVDGWAEALNKVAVGGLSRPSTPPPGFAADPHLAADQIIRHLDRFATIRNNWSRQVRVWK